MTAPPPPGEERVGPAVALLALGLSLPVVFSLVYLVAPEQPAGLLGYLLFESDAGGLLGAGAPLGRILCFGAGALWLMQGPRVPQALRGVSLALAGLIGWSLISALASPFRHDALVVWMDLLVAGLVFVMGADYGSRWAPERWVVPVVAAAVLVLPANFLSLTQPSPFYPYMIGAFQAPNPLAGFSLLFLPLALALTWWQDPPVAGRRLLIWLLGAVLAALLIVCVLMAFSRTAMAVMLLLIVAGLGLARPPLGQGLGMLALVAMLVLGFTRALDPQGERTQFAQHRAERLVKGDSSTSARFKLWSAGLAIARDYPVLGVGPGGFRRVYPRVQNDVRFFSSSPHSWLLTLACEEGFPALLLALCALGLGLRAAWPFWNRHPLARALLLGAGGFLLYDSVDVQLRYPAVVWLMTAAAGLSLAQSPSLSLGKNWRWGGPGLALLAVLQWPLILVDYHLHRGDQTLAARQFEVAYSEYTRALSIDPFEDRAWHQRGLVLLNSLGQPAAALASARRAVELAPDKASHWHLLGLALEKVGQPGSLEAFHQALERDAYNYPIFYYDISNHYQHQGKRDEAFEWLQKAVERFPLEALEAVHQARRPTVEYQLSRVYSSLGEMHGPTLAPVEAERAFRTSLSLQESDTATLGLAFSLYSQQRYQEALSRLRHLEQKRPDFEPALQLQLACHQALGDAAQVARLRRRLAGLRPK
ncbi:MAG: O-antigen ligase family protein [Vulcanimicrobiota bacterium]